MLRHLAFSGVVIFALLGPIVATPQRCSAADALPRYKLQVGRELQYSGQNEFTFESGKFLTDTTWKVWVVKPNDDGSWRLVVRHATMQKDSRFKDNDREDVSFAWCDLDPVGRLPGNDSFGLRLDPYTLLVQLPTEASELKSGWTSNPNLMLHEISRGKYLADKSTPRKAMLEIVREDPLNAIYGFEFKDIVTFDVERGLPERIDSHHRQTYGFNGEGHGTLQLKEIKQHSADWCKNFWADAGRYFAVKKAFEDEVKAAQLAGDRADEMLRGAATRLEGAKAAIQSSELQQQISDDLKQHEQLASYYAERAKNRAALLGSPAADWTCNDFSGKEHALKDYRGRVVVLDFWYRGCGWCIRAMPQVKEVAAHFKDQPVTIFGMNTDRQNEDAQFVIGKMALNYDNLKATGIPEKYKVRGFPTLIIIDQEGIVRDLHNGYSPELKEKVIESIERLLVKK